MAKVRIVVDTPLTATQDAANLKLNGTGSWYNVRRLVDWMRTFVTGSRTSNMLVKVGAVSATGTITFSGVVEDDTVTIGGVVFTGKDAPAGAVQFLTDNPADDEASAASLASVINANTTVNKWVSASAAAEVVTLTSIVPGTIGNAFAVSASAHATISGSGYLTSGSDGTAYNLTLGKALS